MSWFSRTVHDQIILEESDEDMRPDWMGPYESKNDALADAEANLYEKNHPELFT